MNAHAMSINVASKPKTITKNKIKNDFIYLQIEIPEKEIEDFRAFILSRGGTIESKEPENISIPWKCAFSNAHPGLALHGLRIREGLTQKEMAKKLGIAQSNISAMEKGTRLIGKAMAKKIVEVFGGDYRVFL